MTVLYIDTSSSYLYTGILSNSQLIAERKLKLNNQLSVFSLPKIEEMLLEYQLEPRNIDKILVCNGPGSFTGIRIGITIAKTWAWALSIPIATVSSLEAMASSIIDSDYVVPVIDARHDCCYSAIFNRNREEIMPAKYISYKELKNFLESLSGTIKVVSNDCQDFGYPIVSYEPDLKAIMLAFLDRLSINPHMVNPLYLKKTEAEEKLDD